MSHKLEQFKEIALPILKKAGITHSSIFGSVARGEHGSESDIDLIIEFQGKKTLLDLAGLQQELEEALGRKVDLVTRRSIHEPLKKLIEKEEIAIL